MTRPCPVPFTKPECFLLHAAGERARAAGCYERAAYLFFEAAACALTPTGARVLRDKAVEAARLTQTPWRGTPEPGDPVRWPRPASAGREMTPSRPSALAGDTKERTAMDETRSHETQSKLTLPAGTEIKVQDATVTLANETTVRGETKQLDQIRNLAKTPAQPTRDGD